MTQRFDYFAIIAEMRTGSNFLEANLNAIEGLQCYGEAFNPHFIGHKGDQDLLGVGMTQREADPLSLLTAMRAQTDGLPGFRFFHDHDPRVLDHILQDRRCAKIILTRNPLDSYVSLKIAGETGQWKLTDARHHKTARVSFNTVEFENHLDALHRFQVRLLHALQTSGQTAFYIGYDDTGDIDVLNGLADWLGIAARLDQVSAKLKKQNPQPLSEKVVNYDAMKEALARIDRFDLTRTPNFEPRRGPGVPGFVAAAESAVLFMPIPGGPADSVQQWLTELDGGRVPEGGFSQKTLRQWKRRHRPHRAFTVVSHPVARAFRAYGDLMTAQDDRMGSLRDRVRQAYDVPLPDAADAPADEHAAGFEGFLRFLKGNLSSQTSIHVQPGWATQSAVLQGMGQFQLPDMILRAERLAQDLHVLADALGLESPPLQPEQPVLPVALADIYTEHHEEAARAAYQRDYMMFGYGPWA